MKKFLFLVVCCLCLAGCEEKIDTEKLNICCSYYDGEVSNKKCVFNNETSTDNEKLLNECMKESENLRFGISTYEGQDRTYCCLSNGGTVVDDVCQDTFGYFDNQDFKECLEEYNLD